jgi:hypothetical protein
MDGVSGSLGAAALGLLKSEAAQNIVMRMFHKLWKKIRLKNVQCIVVNDCDRRKLKFKYDDAKYQFLDVESVYLSLLSDGEIARLGKLKEMNIRSFIISTRVPCKRLLTNIRTLWKNETVILCVSNVELAKELHIPKKNTFVFCQDKEYHEQLLESLPDESRPYMKELYDRNKRGDYHMEEYKSHQQLVERLEKRFA